MAKKYRVKDIAILAGVSAGTVDRVIHNRGEVSSKSRQKVEKVLAEIDYFQNTSMSLPENGQKFHILAILPQHMEGDYWDAVKKGIDHVVYYSVNIELKVKYLYYNQFDLYSCRETFEKALSTKSDAILIGPSFYDETLLFVNQLFMRDIPYVFIDTLVENTKPLAFFGPHPYQTGVVQARLLTTILEEGKDIVLFQARRIGDKTSVQSLTRSYGFVTYLKENYPHIKVHSGQYDYENKKESDQMLDQLFAEHRNIGGAVVFDTKGHLIAEYLKERDITSIKLIGFGTSQRNVISLKDGSIDFLISERPEYQGEAAMKAVIDFLLYNKVGEVENYTPIDILIKETIGFYTVS